MYITLETDYAIRMLCTLYQRNERLGARVLAEASDVPLRFALKILGKLSSAGLVTSYMGSRGGYTAARLPEDLTLYHVLEAMEGAYCFSRCLEEGYCCPRNESGHCKVHRIFDSLTREISSRLQAVSFADILADKGCQADP